MLYLGHFKVVTDEHHYILNHDHSDGYFTCLVEAENVGTAIDKFFVLIEKLRYENNELSRIRMVKMYSCIEIKRVPESGLLTHYVRKKEDAEPLQTFWLPSMMKSINAQSDVVETESIMGMGWDID